MTAEDGWKNILKLSSTTISSEHSNQPKETEIEMGKRLVKNVGGSTKEEASNKNLE